MCISSYLNDLLRETFLAILHLNYQTLYDMYEVCIQGIDFEKVTDENIFRS